MIKRQIASHIEQKIRTDNKVVVLYGPRRVGKTTLINQILDDIDAPSLRINAEERLYTYALNSLDVSKLKSFIGENKYVFIDEAQYLENAGLTLKLIHDHLPSVKLIATGSSSFDLSQNISQPLTGRKWTFQLLPIAISELASSMTEFELNKSFDQRLIWGSYPDILSLTNDLDRKKYLVELSTDYLYRDVLKLVNIKNANKIRNLLRLLAFQVGSQVSLTEIGTQLEMSKDTVANYIDLLEKSFVLFRLTAFSGNLRKEVSKSDKFYFYDLGVRNVLIDDLKPINLRNDLGRLWENFLVMERLKLNTYSSSLSHPFFWRVYTGGEIDYVEQEGVDLRGYEFKYGKKTVSPPPTWTVTYPHASFQVINRDNFLEFVTKN